MNRIKVCMNGGKEYEFNINSDRLQELIFTTEGDFKNTLVRVEDVFINPINISSVEFVHKHSIPPKFTGISR